LTENIDAEIKKASEREDLITEEEADQNFEIIWKETK